MERERKELVSIDSSWEDEYGEEDSNHETNGTAAPYPMNRADSSSRKNVSVTTKSSRQPVVQRPASCLGCQGSCAVRTVSKPNSKNLGRKFYVCASKGGCSLVSKLNMHLNPAAAAATTTWGV